jgi:glycosyltransferase involved in cell wall biosynthesis
MKEENKNSLPLVSVILACYNCEKYVQVAVQSIIDQTYQNLEILITDDCSTDNSYNILKQFVEKDHRVILKRNDVNLKLAKTLNNAIAGAKGKYIARMDADDISMPKRIEKQVLWLENHHDYGVLGTNVWLINSEGKKWRKSVLPITNEEINSAKYFGNPFCHPAVMIRADAAKTHRYNEEFDVAQDYELWFNILNDYKGFNLRQNLLQYRISSGSVSGTQRDKQMEMVVLIYAKYLTNNDLELSRKYLYEFLISYKKRNDHKDLDGLIMILFNKIHDFNGYNFNILLLFFKYFFFQGKTLRFVSHLPIREHIKFLVRLLGYTHLYIFSYLKKRIIGIT